MQTTGSTVVHRATGHFGLSTRRMSSIPRASPALGRIEASIFGESALLDRETGRILWESGTSSTLYESLTPKLDQYGVEHFQAFVLTVTLTLALFGIFTEWLHRAIVQLPEHYSVSSTKSLQLISILIVLADWTIFKLPKVQNRWLVSACILLYLLESYNCSTRRLLAHPISSSAELDDYLDLLRQVSPIVTWNVKTFHYEYRWFFLLPHYVKSLVRSLFSTGPGSSSASAVDYTLRKGDSRRHTSAKSILSRKVVTNEASAVYQYVSCKDDTMVGLWTRAQAFNKNDDVPPFTKIALTKLVILANQQTREDYFQQQSNFITRHGQGDKFAEFSTDIQVAGYRSRVLAIQRKTHPLGKAFRLHFFWVFTLLGLTVPYRIWFKQHCDFVRVTLIKETSSIPKSSRGWVRSSLDMFPSPGAEKPSKIGETIFGL
jgi:hypothetical protein